MSEQVSTFLDVKLGRGNYLFFLVTWNDYKTRLKEELQNQFEPFGADLGRNGRVIRSYDRTAADTYKEIIEKSWPSDIRERISREQDPFLLIIDKDFDEFDPNEHKWNIIWLSDFWQSPEVLYRLFGSLATRVRDGEDIFNWVNSLARRDRYRRIAKHVAIKPGIFGASIDVKAILEEMTGLGPKIG